MMKTYDDQKQDLLKIAKDKFGNNYFEQLDKLSQDYLSDGENPFDYTLTANHKGAFYASAE